MTTTTLTRTANETITQYVSVNGVKIAYRKLGPENGIPLVLFHRFRATMDQWDPKFLDTLAEKRPVIIFDNLGVGRSEGVSADSIDGMAQSAADFIQALGYDKVDILGWSMGGMVAYAFALNHKNMVRKAISAGSTPGLIAGSPQPPEKVGEVARKPVNDAEDFLYLFFPLTDEGRKLGQTHLNRLDKRQEEVSPPVSLETLMAQAKSAIAWRSATGVYPKLGDLDVPFLIANGEEDVMIPASDSIAASKALPGSKLLIYKNAAHGFLFQDDLNFTDEVIAFLEN